MPNSASRIAPAKVNLYLHVLGKRTDGLHELQSLVTFASIGDGVEVTPSDKRTLEIDGPFGASISIEEPGQNLVVKAARRALSGTGKRVHIRLTKNLPVAAGVGGGSADAAAVLHCLNDMLGTDYGEPAAWANLGADIPVSLLDRPALAEGMGERLTPAPHLPALPAVLVNPGEPSGTRSVFKALAGRYGQPAIPALPPEQVCASVETFIGWLSNTRNDLTEPGAEIVPAIREALSALQQTPGVLLARMSGSGATCFGLCPTMEAADEAAASLSGRAPGWWVRATMLKGTGDQ